MLVLINFRSNIESDIDYFTELSIYELVSLKDEKGESLIFSC